MRGPDRADGVQMHRRPAASKAPPPSAQPISDDDASFVARSVLLSVLVVCIGAVGQIVGALIGFGPGVSLLGGCVLGIGSGIFLAQRLVVAPALASDAKRRAMIARIERVTRADREELFDDLLICSSDKALGPLAHAVHDALVRAHRDRLEAAALRREMVHKVDRETTKRTATLTTAAERDELTGLLNRRGFDRRLADTIDDARETGVEVTLLAMDMDRFKRLNDNHGHEKGDEALRIAGDLISAHTRDGDLGARVGGDELFLVLRDADAAAATDVGERLISLFTNHPAGSDLDGLWPGLSIGIARLLGDGAADADQLKKLADNALYQSKNNGRGRVTLARAA